MNSKKANPSGFKYNFELWIVETGYHYGRLKCLKWIRGGFKVTVNDNQTPTIMTEHQFCQWKSVSNGKYRLGKSYF